MAEIQRSCIAGQLTDDMCLVGVEMRIGVSHSSQKVGRRSPFTLRSGATVKREKEKQDLSE
jgi:hypothetical protein